MSSFLAGLFLILLFVGVVVAIYAFGAALVVGGVHELARGIRDNLRDDECD